MCYCHPSFSCLLTIQNVLLIYCPIWLSTQKHSTLQQMLVFFNEIYNSINNNSQVDAVYLDFKKAFDRVAHKELLFKLWSLGITRGTWRWLKAYLTDRQQCVLVHNHQSSPKVKCQLQQNITNFTVYRKVYTRRPCAIIWPALNLNVTHTETTMKQL